MKVYVMTKAGLFQPEQFVDVASTKKKALELFRKEFPHMRPDGMGGDGYYSDASANPTLLFIHEVEVK